MELEFQVEKLQAYKSASNAGQKRSLFNPSSTTYQTLGFAENVIEMRANQLQALVLNFETSLNHWAGGETAKILQSSTEAYRV